jgi:Domain of unknown function (DUF4111)
MAARQASLGVPAGAEYGLQDEGVVSSALVEFGGELAVVLNGLLGDDLVGVYFVGSVALGGYVPGESDVDIIGVTSSTVADQQRQRIAQAVVDITPRCPARGLEFTLYCSEVVARSPHGADFELNANGGPRMERTIHLDAAAEPGFWYVLDRAVAQQYGIAIVGPPAADVFAEVARSTLLDAMAQSMRWHREHEKATLYSVLNACRAWRFAVDDVLGSKLDGAAWARSRWVRPDVIDAAVELRHGRSSTLNVADVEDLLRFVEEALLTST